MVMMIIKEIYRVRILHYTLLLFVQSYFHESWL